MTRKSMKLVDELGKFFVIPNIMIEVGVPAKIGTSAWTVYTALKMHTNNSSGECYPSVELLEFETGLSNRVIAQSIRTMRDLGFIEVQRQYNQHNLYTIKNPHPVIKKLGWRSRDEKSSAQKLVTKSHVARDEKSPELVTKSHSNKTNKTRRKEQDKYMSPSKDGDTQALGAMPLKKQCQQVIDIWNQNRGILPAANLTPTRQKTLERLIKTYGLTELETLVGKAAQFVAKSDFWQERKYGFDNLLSKEKFVQHAESYDVEFPQSKAACSAAKFNPASLQPGVTVENLQGRRGVVVEVRETLVVVRVGTMCVNWPLEAVKGVL